MPIVNHTKLSQFCTDVLKNMDVSEKDAQIVTDVLVASDLRGIPSHGVARLARYINGLKDGSILKNTTPSIETETKSTAGIDAHDGLGQPAGYFAMNLAIQKAKESGVGVISVKNSNHYGIAGYYPLMALEHDLIGISLTNTNPLVVPTFGRDMLMGTNPISFAAPSAAEYPFVLDMATSTVPRGKIEVYNRLEKELPKGWALDETGATGTNPKRIVDNMLERTGGGLTPLGGEGELLGGHKGFGLSLLVDILSGVLSGAAYASGVGSGKHPNVGHFFMALRVENFIELDEFKKRMDDYIKLLHNFPKAEGQNRIYVHGEKEFEREKEYKEKGLRLENKVYNALKEFGEEFSVEFNIKLTAS